LAALLDRSKRSGEAEFRFAFSSPEIFSEIAILLFDKIFEFRLPRDLQELWISGFKLLKNRRWDLVGTCSLCPASRRSGHLRLCSRGEWRERGATPP